MQGGYGGLTGAAAGNQAPVAGTARRTVSPAEGSTPWTANSGCPNRRIYWNFGSMDSIKTNPEIND